METLITFLIALVVFLIIAGIVQWLVRLIVGNLPIDPPIRNAILALAALILLILFLVFVQRQGWFSF